MQQLVWEAQSVSTREPGWAPASVALMSALASKEHHTHAYPWLACNVETVCKSPKGAVARPRVVVASMFCGEGFLAQMRPARDNHARWCALHGYAYACLEHDIANRGDPTWSKLPHVLGLLQKGADFVFWMDADSLFIHDAADLEWACELDRDLVFAGDLNVVFNAGHFLARRGQWAMDFLRDAFRIYPWPDWEDNGAMMVLLGGGSADHPETWKPCFHRMCVPTRSFEECAHAQAELLPSAISSQVAVVPQHRMNSYEWPGGGGLVALARGDPILHFAGCSAKEKAQLVARFASCTGDPDVLLRLSGARG